jgi:hypothetical protein
MWGRRVRGGERKGHVGSADSWLGTKAQPVASAC